MSGILALKTVLMPGYLTARLQAEPGLPLLRQQGGGYVMTLPAPGGVAPELDQYDDPTVESKHFDLCNYRTVQSPPAQSPHPPSTLGLDTLRMSGSAQFSRLGLHEALASLLTAVPGLKTRDVYLYDLRDEPHLEVDGLPLCWRLADPRQAHGGLQTFLFGETRTLGGWVQTEAHEAETLGLHYIHNPVVDKTAPLNPAIDRFTQDMLALPPHAWVHFHCAAGLGRTTTFMCFRDMMYNARQVSFDDIIARQALIGGEDLSKVAPGDPEEQKRYEVLRNYYQYCKTNTDNYRTPYSLFAGG